ncbi:MAG: hypothetical protein K2P87_01120 [Lachnospiraceae bacterium]|nr:hypothetical protein [Lachnospiraceae bacterium]
MGEGKPKYLYHGSPYLFDRLIPQPASGACEQESLTAIYAAGSMEEVIPFALPIRWYPDSPEGRRDFKCAGGSVEIIYGSLDPEGAGYVYRVRSDSFVKIDEWQWVSETEVVPEEVIRIKVRDYWHTVRFLEEAERIQQEVWGQIS